jgi:peptidoglycan/xylan/chitin deacetylase (PgdA/CDA1 family)
MKKLIIMATLAAAAGCSADITPEDVKVADYKDGKECAVSLTFDDSMKEHYTIVAPELEKRGFRGTFWMVGSWMPTDPQADTTHFTWAEAKEMSDRGHEMSNHTWSHPYLTMLSDEELLNEIKKNDEAILANIGKPSTTFCFPYNAFNEKVIAAAMEGRIGARLKEFWLGGQHSPKEYLQKQVEDALASGSWIAGMTHGINYGYDCYTDPTEFTDFLDYLKSLESRIWVGTFRDVAAYTAVAKDVKLTVEPADKGVTVTPATSLDKTLYETPLTMTVNTDGKKIKAEQDGNPLEITYSGDNAYLTFCPFGGPVTIR